MLSELMWGEDIQRRQSSYPEGSDPYPVEYYPDTFPDTQE